MAVNKPDSWYNIHQYTLRYGDTKPKYTQLDYIFKTDTIWFLKDMEIFGTIAQLSNEGYKNIPIVENSLIIDGLDIVFIMILESRKYNYLSFIIVTRQYSEGI